MLRLASIGYFLLHVISVVLLIQINKDSHVQELEIVSRAITSFFLRSTIVTCQWKLPPTNQPSECDKRLL